jgi:hypothetical protein
MHEVLMLGISEGASHADLACRLSAEAEESIPWYIIRGWIEANCADDVALAYRARADVLNDAADRVVAQATMENLGVDKLQAERYAKQAATFDNMKYGNGEARTAVGGVGGITIVIGQVQPAGITVEQSPTKSLEVVDGDRVAV